MKVVHLKMRPLNRACLNYGKAFEADWQSMANGGAAMANGLQRKTPGPGIVIKKSRRLVTALIGTRNWNQRKILLGHTKNSLNHPNESGMVKG